MKKFKFNLWVVIGLFLIMYNPPVLPFNSMHLVGVISLIYYIRNKTVNGYFSVDSRMPKIYATFFTIFLYLFIEFLCFKDAQISNLFFPVYFMLDFIPFALAVKLYGDRRGAMANDYIELILMEGTFQGVLSIAAYLIPAVQQFFINCMLAYGYDDIYQQMTAHRMYGFADGLTFATAAMQAALGVLGIAYGINKGHEKRYYLMGALMCISGIINARTAIVVILVGIFAFYLSSKIKLKKKILMLILILILVLTIAFIIIPVMERYSPKNVEWLTEGFNEIKTLLTGGGASGYFTYVTNEKRTVVPNTFFDFMFGLGVRTMGGHNRYGARSDIGYINDIWLGGLFYCILLYTVFGHFILKMRKMKNPTVSYWGNMLLIAFPVLNVKGVICDSNCMSRILFLTFVLFTFQNKKQLAVRE